MNKNTLLAHVRQLCYAIEDLPAGEKQTKCSVMASELSRRIETDGKYPQPLMYPLEPRHFTLRPESKSEHLPTIIIEVIPHANHRYTTVGDWFFDEGDGTLHIKVSELSDWRMEALIAVHELIEVLACKHAGITVEQVDKFDMYDFSYKDHPDDEPGDDPKAPYKKQHCIATGMERILAAVFDVDWKPYEEELNDLPEVELKK